MQCRLLYGSDTVHGFSIVDFFQSNFSQSNFMILNELKIMQCFIAAFFSLAIVSVAMCNLSIHVHFTAMQSVVSSLFNTAN